MLCLKHAYKHLKEEPDCVEKFLVAVLYPIHFLLFGKKSNDQILLADINNDCDRLVNRLKVEEEYDKYSNTIEQIQSSIRAEDWSVAKRELIRLYKEFNIFDVNESLRLIEKADKATGLIKDKEILLLLGNTGVGKSTTTHFLAGSTLRKVTALNKISHIEPEIIRNPDLQKVKTSADARSKTRYITPVRIDFERDIPTATYALKRKGGIILCDTPGFFETLGAEVDVANGFGIVKAIRTAKSVRPLLLNSAKSGDKYEGLKKPALTLIRLVPNLPQLLDTFSYGFTKYRHDEYDQIHPQINAVVNALTDADKVDKAHEILLQDMADQTRDQPNIIDPIGGDPNQVWTKILGKPAIHHPEEEFQFFINEESKIKIQKQLQRFHLQIISAVSRSEFNLVDYRLKQMRDLNDKLNQPFIKMEYEECVKIINKTIQEEYRQKLEAFNACVENRNTFTTNDIVQYQATIDNLRKAEGLRSNHLGKDAIHYEALVKNVEKQFDVLQDQFFADLHKEKFNTIELKSQWRNIKVLTNSFKDLGDKLNRVNQSFRNFSEESVIEATTLIDTHQFDQAAVGMYKIKELTKILDQEEEQRVHQHYVGLTAYLLQNLSRIGEQAKQNLKRGIEKSHITALEQALLVLENAKDTPSLKEHMNMEEIKHILGCLYADIQTFFSSHNKEIGGILRAPTIQQNEMESLMNDLLSLREISVVASRTSEIYHQTVSLILLHITHIKNEAQSIIDKMHTTPSGYTNYPILIKCLLQLKDTSWMNKIKPGIYEEKLDNVFDDFNNYIKKLKDEMQNLDLRSKPNDLKSAHKIFVQIKDMEIFENTFPKLQAQLQQIREVFNKAVNQVFQSVKEDYNLKGKGVAELKEHTNELSAILQKYEKLHSANLFLAQQEYQDIGSLNDAIKKEEDGEEDRMNILESKRNEKNSSIEELRGKNNNNNSKNKNNSQATRLLTELLDIEKQIDSFDDTKKSLQLNSIRQGYEELLKTNNNPKGLEFIKEKGFHSHEELIQKKIKLECAIRDMESGKMEYNFEKLNAAEAEQRLKYLSECETLYHIRNEAKDSMTLMARYLEKYCSQRIESDLKIWWDALDGFVKDIVEENIPKITSRLQELKDIVTLYPAVSIQMKVDSNTIQFWRTKIDGYVSGFDTNLHEYKKNLGILQDQRLADKLSLTRIFRQLEHVNGLVDPKNSFTDVYKQYLQTVTNGFHAAHNSIIASIEADNYNQVAAALSQANHIPPPFLLIIRKHLSNRVAELIRSTLMKSKLLQKDLPEKDIQVIQNNILSLKSVQTNIIAMDDDNQYIDKATEKKLNDFTIENNATLSKKMLSYLKDTEQKYAVQNIQEVNDRLQHSVLICSLLECDLVEEVAELRKKVADEVESLGATLYESFKQKKISEYFLDPPKELIENLTKAGPAFSTFIFKINAHIMEVMMKKIQELRAAPPDDRRELQQEIESALISLPPALKQMIENQLTHANTDAQKKETGLEENLKNAISNKDASKLGELFDKFTAGSYATLKSKLTYEATDLISELKTGIDKSLDEDQFKDALDKVRKLREYKEHLSKHIPAVDKLCEAVQTRLSNSLNNLQKSLLNISTMTPDIYKNAFSAYWLFYERNDQVAEFITFTADEKDKVFNTIIHFFQENQKKFDDALCPLDVTSLRNLMDLDNKWDGFFRYFKSLRHDNTTFSQAMSQLKVYADKVQILSSQLAKVKEAVQTFDLEDRENTRTEHLRTNYHVILSSKLLILQQSKELKEHSKLRYLQHGQGREENV